MPETAKLYVIPGSHACRTAMLMLEHKGIPYRTVELLTGMHSMAVRLHGFPGHRKPIRNVDGKVGPMLGLMDRMGTVPALRIGAQKIQTNKEIALYLEQSHPQPPLYPANPERRRAVEEARLWGDEQLQMKARRAVLAGGEEGLDVLHMRGGSGRLGALLSNNERMRTIASSSAARLVFGAPAEESQKLREELEPMLDRVDGWVEQGVLNGEQPNIADFTIAPSLALLSYRLDMRDELAQRPLYALIERLLPEPAAAG
jgi:glutathione S-transferase